MNRILSSRSSYRTNLWLPGAQSGGVWDGHVHTVVFIKDNQQGPTVYAHGALFNVSVFGGGEGSLEENGMYIYIYIYMAEAL